MNAFNVSEVNAGAVTVAVLFGGLMGWVLRARLTDLRPAVVAMVVGLVVGAGALFGSGDEAAMASGSLRWGCGAGLVLLFLPLPRRRAR